MQNDDSALGTVAGTKLEGSTSHLPNYVPNWLGEPKKLSAAGHWSLTGPAVTISEQTGAGAHEIAMRLAELLQASERESSAPWRVFDHQLVDKVLEENHLPNRLAHLMPEDRRSYLDDVLDEIIGLRPPSWELVPLVIKSILHLAESGHVILVGRGASFVTALMPNVFQVRLISALARRIERVQRRQKISAKAAAEFIARTDRARARYVRAYFRVHVEDDLQFHLALNIDRIPAAAAAALIADGARRCHRRQELERGVKGSRNESVATAGSCWNGDTSACRL